MLSRYAARRPCEARVDACERIDPDLVVRADRVARRDARPLRARERGLEREHGVGLLRRVARAGEREQPREIGDARSTRGDEARLVGDEVVVAVGKQEPRLADRRQPARRIARVERDRERERSARAEAVEPADRGGDVVAGRDLVDRRQLAGERRQAGTLGRALVHEAAIERGDAALVVIARSFHCVFDDREQLAFGPLAQRDEAADARPLGRDRRRLQPSAVDMTEEVVLLPHAGVDGGPVDPCRRRCRAARATDDQRGDERTDTERAAPARARYQIETRCSGGRYMRSPGLTPNVE